MKAAAFDYVKATSLDEVCRVLAASGDGAEPKIIAGGQTLVPLMAMRLARPTLLVDINGIEALKRIERGRLHRISTEPRSLATSSGA